MAAQAAKPSSVWMDVSGVAPAPGAREICVRNYGIHRISVVTEVADNDAWKLPTERIRENENDAENAYIAFCCCAALRGLERCAECARRISNRWEHGTNFHSGRGDTAGWNRYAARNYCDAACTNRYTADDATEPDSGIHA